MPNIFDNIVSQPTEEDILIQAKLELVVNYIKDITGVKVSNSDARYLIKMIEQRYNK